MSNNWEKRPFQIAPGSLKNNEMETDLPFSIGGITRQGFEHIRCGISNQDALNFKMDKKLIIAVLCDGCTSHEESLISDYSANVVGSNLLAEMISSFCFQDIKPRKNKMKLDIFIRRLNTEIHHRLRRLMKILLIKGKEQLPFLFNMMTTTVIVTVIREKEYFVFHCGDGLVKINGTSYNLEFDSGSYLTNAFDPNFNKNTPLIKLITSGETKDLNHLFMASDGFDHSTILESSYFKETFEKTDYPHTGFIDLIPEFHIDIIEPYYQEHQNLRRWPVDDASLIMLRRKELKQ